MTAKSALWITVALTALLVAVIAGCTDKYSAHPAPFPTDPEVFVDGFGPNVTYQAFGGSKLDAVQIDESTSHIGSQSLIVTVPDYGDPSGSYAGGAFVTTVARDLTQYNALTFWAKASRDVTLDVAGIGNDNTGTSRFIAEVHALPVTTSWTKLVVPIPLSAKLEAEKGLFYFAEGPEEGEGCQIWFDDIRFESLGTITNPRPAIATEDLNAFVGDTIRPEGGIVAFDVAGDSVTVFAMPGYYTYGSSDNTVINVAGNGVITAVGAGTAEITATLGTVPAIGTMTVEVSEAPTVPTTPAPTPTVPASDVISLFSNAYTNVPVDTWSTDWDDATVIDEQIAGNDVKKYQDLVIAGIEFTNPTIDATSMSHFHMDIWTPNSTAAPARFRVKLVDFGADGVYGGPGSDDTEHELTFTENTIPALESGSWVSIDVPFSAFSGLLNRGHLAQLIISGDLSIVYVDNLYFYDANLPTAPLVPAPTPTVDAGKVVSLYSDAYTDVPVETWSAVWDSADVEDYVVGSDSTKKYTNLLFAGIEFKSPTVDASAMTNFHMDVWTPDWTAAPAVFKIKLVDFGADGTYGGGDDVEHELTLGENTMNTASWVGIDLPLADFTGLTTRGHLGQMIISGDPNTVYVDNIYFYDADLPTAPQVSAPTPSADPANVISLFSDAYTNVPVDTWSAVWDVATVSNYLIGTDSVKKYTGLLFAGVEIRTNTIDASTMTHFHMDVWTPDATSSPAVFKVKLVDFGANGASGGGDDVEDEVVFDHNTMNTSSWVSLDIALADLTSLTTRGHIGQLIISGDPDTVYVDNVYFYK